MKIDKEVALRDYNTFGVDATADWLIRYSSVEELQTLVRDEYFQECRFLHIGEGSNLLFLSNFHGIVLYSEICTIELLEEHPESVDLLVGAGVRWDDFVAHCVRSGYYGVENLSLIPGQVGSAAIQNIGAYGVEVEQCIIEVHTIHRRSGQQRIFTHGECGYAYRHSIFKEPDYTDYIVTHVRFRLSRVEDLRLGYADVQRYLSEHALEPSLSVIREAIIAIRQSKLPDTKVLGNAGSYFINPVISAEQVKALQSLYPELPVYPLSDGRGKVAAGWLIDQCGLKGYRRGDAGVYERQALVLVNHGKATGQDIANLAIEIQDAVRERFGIELVPEVKYIS